MTILAFKHKSIFERCFKCSLWEVVGGVESLTCDSTNTTGNNSMTCRDLSIPPCADRTVYCTFPPKAVSPTSTEILENPSPYYENAASK